MANQIVSVKSIEVHSRGSLDIHFVARNKATKAQINIADRIMFFEVDGVPIREQLVPHPTDPLGLLLVLERNQVEILSKLPTSFSVVDETRIAEGRPKVLWEGTIKRFGYKGAPDATDDA